MISRACGNPDLLREVSCYLFDIKTELTDQTVQRYHQFCCTIINDRTVSQSDKSGDT